MKLFIFLLSLFSIFSSLVLAAFSDDFDDDGFGIGGIGGSGLGTFGGDNCELFSFFALLSPEIER